MLKLVKNRQETCNILIKTHKSIKMNRVNKQLNLTKEKTLFKIIKILIKKFINVPIIPMTLMYILKVSVIKTIKVSVKIFMKINFNFFVKYVLKSFFELSF